MNNKLHISTLGHTWILDLDGTIVKHNGYKINGQDTFIEGAKEFLMSIPEKDMILFLTSRDERYKKETERFLAEQNVRYDLIIYGAPYGERILINDKKPSGLCVSLAISTDRDVWNNIEIIEDSNL